MPNVRLLLISAVAVGSIGAVGHFWHGFQLKRNAAALLRRVDRSLEAGEQKSALTRLRQYLKLRPDDADQQVRLAQLVDRAATTRPEKDEALRLHTLAIGFAPENADLLRRRAELSYELERFAEAIRQADDLLRKDGDDAGAVRVKALALAAQARLAGEPPGDRLAELFERAVKHSPGDVELALGLARIYRAQMPLTRDSNPPGRAEKASLADRVMKRLIDASPRSPDAYLARYHYRTAYGLAGADDDLRQALALDSEGKHFSVLVAAGLKQLAKGAAEQAAALFHRAITAGANDERGYLGLGRAREAAGDRPAAQAAWRQGLKAADASSPALNFELARSLVADGRADEAQGFLERLENELRRRAGQIAPNERGQWLDRAAELRADWHFAQGEYARAAELLEGLIGGRTSGDARQDRDQRSARLHARLAAALARLGQWDRAIGAYQKAVALAPDLSEHRLALANAYQRAGRLDDAVVQFRQLVKIDAPPPSAWVLSARALLEQQLAVRADRRQWEEFDQVLQRARDAAPDEPELMLLEAERSFATGALDSSADRLMQYVDASHDDSFCERSCAVLQRWGRLDEADRCLRHAQQIGLPEGRRVLTAAALAAARHNLDDAERVLRSALDVEGTEQPTEIGLRLALVLLAGGKVQPAKEELESLYRRHSEHLRVVQLLAELAWEEADFEALEVNERRLRKLEGPRGTLWRFFRGLRLSIESDDGGRGREDDARLAAAERLQAELEQARPNWPATFLLKSRLADRRKRPSEAIAACFQAIRLGERRQQVYAYLATRLYQQGRYAEAHAVLDELKSRQPLSISLSGLELALEVRTGELPSAFAAARRQVEQRPNDASAHVWLGQILAVGGKHDEAEAALRRGVELAPADARPWTALLQHCLTAGDGQRARDTFEQMQASVEVSAKQRPFLLAQCHELLGDREQAAAFYQQAVVAAPDAAAVWQSAARFYRGFDRLEAEACLRRVVELRPESALARRMLATLIVEREGETSLADAAELLEAQGVARADQIANHRLNARLALRHGAPPQRQEAQRILEELVERDPSPAPRERLLLAHWYEREGKLRAAKEQLLALALVDRPAADDLARLVEFLLRHQRAAEAGEWLDQLSQIEPEDGSLRTTSLRATWLIQRGKQDEVETVVGRFLHRDTLAQRTPSDRAAAWVRIAGLYAAAQLPEQAEASYRRAASEHASGGCSYARWLAASGRVAESISVCLAQANADDSPQTAITLAAVLGHRADTESAAPGVESCFAESLRRHATSAMLRTSLGTLRMLQGDGAKAQELFEQALALQPDHLVALNNLAMLLADDPARRAEAMTHLDRALVLAGRHPELLDSKGWLLLQSEDAVTAEALFREAAELAPADPRPSFHLALSCWLQGKTEEARQALDRARQHKLSVNQLNGPERRRLAELELAFDG